jgi:hypothetical protein
MKRLDTNTLPAFLESSGLAVMLVGAEEAPIDAHAYDFARLWAACVESGRHDIRFGYVDVTSTPGAHTLAGTAPLPVILMLNDGQVVCRSVDKNLASDPDRARHRDTQRSEPRMSMAA